MIFRWLKGWAYRPQHGKPRRSRRERAGWIDYKESLAIRFDPMKGVWV